MKKNVNFKWDEDSGLAVCKIKYDGLEFTGEAQCHPKDEDMMSSKTGEEIAYNRASIAVLQYEKKQIARELKALKALYYSMKHSPRFNAKSYEAYSLYRQMNIRQNDINEIKYQIKCLRSYLKSYIDGKDEIYKKIRHLREKEKLEQGNTK